LKIDTVSEKVLLSSLAASVALAIPVNAEATTENNSIIFDDISIDPNESFSFGETGYKIRTIQQKLFEYDLIALDDNGYFGVKTHAAIRQFQKLKKLNVNGVADPETLHALFINKDIDEIEVEDHILVKINEGQLLSFGDRGEAVKHIQNFLLEAGYYHHEKDGIFGAHTQEAVKNYQKDNGLVIDGIVGEETYVHLTGVTVKVKSNPSDENINSPIYSAQEELDDNSTSPVIVPTIVKIEKNDLSSVDFLQNGDTGQAVKDLQKLLKNKGYFVNRIDGVFGPRTEAAVRTYQNQNNLVADGIAGKKTIIHLKTSPSTKAPSRSDNPPTQNNTSVPEDNHTEPSVEVDGSSESIINLGKSLIGTRYLWGGTTPNGFDCSGFLVYIYKKNGISIPRTVSDIWNVAKSVQSPKRGDIVFFQTYKKGPSHAGIYLGDQKFLHTSSSKGVSIGDMSISYWSSRYLGAKRIK
jgi:cell wall-associated NlpC family hydrolase